VLVSDQTLANLIPALMERPKWVVLVCSQAMARKGQCKHLERLLERHGIATRVQENAPDVGLAAIHDYAIELADHLEADHPHARITLNATGGTKLMALGFIEAFRALDCRILYTDTAHRRLEILPHGREAPPPPIDMTDVLDVPGYLAAQGFHYDQAASDAEDWRHRAAARKSLSKYLARNAAELGSFIGKINALANAALQRKEGSEQEYLANPTQSLGQKPWGRWVEALRECARAQVLCWQDGATDITFASAEAAQFLRGGWLEEYAWHVVKDEGAYDVRLGMQGRWHNDPDSRNEFDVLATHRNQLLFIECKTLRFEQAEDTDNVLSYKLDSLGKQVRGLFGQTWLLTARKPTETLLARAKQAGFRVFNPEELPRLRDAVREWLGG
jgi:hypothetical protein